VCSPPPGASLHDQRTDARRFITCDCGTNRMGLAEVPPALMADREGPVSLVGGLLAPKVRPLSRKSERYAPSDAGGQAVWS
jgi:hypothetical protein